MFEVLSIASTTIVFIALVYLAFRMPALLVKPSTLFLVFFCLQVQVSSAINANAIAGSLANPWTFFMLVHGFALACLPIIFFFCRREAEYLYCRIGMLPSKLRISQISAVAILLLFLNYAVVAVYLSYIPFEKTGVYAMLFEPKLHDSYRQLSMKLIPGGGLRYLFALLEKVFAPVSGATCAILLGLALRAKQPALALAAVLGIGLSVLPATLYGARGPGAMVVLVAIFTWFLMFSRRVSVSNLVMAALLVLLLPVSMMVWKSQSFQGNVLVFQTMNIADRIVGRGYIDNVWHLKRIEENGIYGVPAIEKLALLFGKKPIDVFNEVAVANQGNAPVFGIKYLEIADPIILNNAPAEKSAAKLSDSAPSPTDLRVPESSNPKLAGQIAKCDQATDVDCIDITKSASAGASFVIMNYAIFGTFGIFLSYLFIFAMDGLLFLYRRTGALLVVQSVASVAVPVLTLSFSLFTTVLASKGLLLIPFFCLLLGWTFNRTLGKS